MDFLSLPVFYYDALSSQARSCLMLIKLLNIDVELRPIDMMNNMNFDETYLWINSFCMFPTLRDGNITLCNGSQILIYLSQKYCVASDLPKLCPSDYISRLKIMNMLMYEGFILQRLNQLLTDIFLANYPNFNVDYHKNKVWDIYNSLNIYLKGHNFMLGNRLTIADIAFVSSVSALNVIFPIDYEMYPRFFDWLQRLKKMHFYTSNEEGLLKLRYFLDKMGKFPIPSPFSYQAENAETSSNDKDTEFNHQFNMNGNKNNVIKQSKKLSLDSKTDQIESVAEVSGFSYNERNMEVNSESEIFNVYNADVTNTCRCRNGLCNFHGTHFTEDTFSRNLNQFKEANETYRRRANSNSNHFKMYGCCHLPYRKELEFDWSCSTPRTANDSWQFEMPPKETKSCIYVQYYNVSPYNKESYSPSSSRGTELYGGVKQSKCFCCCNNKSRPHIRKFLINTRNSNQGKRLYHENFERGSNTHVCSGESDEYDGSNTSNKEDYYLKKQKRCNHSSLNDENNETFTNHYSRDTGPVIPTHDKKNENNNKSGTLIEKKEIKSDIFQNDDHSETTSRESKIDQTFLKHYNPVQKSDITLNDKQKINSENSENIIIENEKNYTKESPDLSDRSQSDISKNDKPVIKSDKKLNDKQNNDSENSEITIMENELSFTKESPEHTDKSQSDIFKNDKPVIKSDITLNGNQNNDSENSEITTMENAINYTNESPKYSIKSQSDLPRNDKPVINTDVALNDKQNDDSENTEIITMGNETNYTKESLEHLEKSQSDIFKNDKHVIKSDITVNDNQNNDSENSEIITMENATNYTNEIRSIKSQSDLSRNDKPVINTDVALNEKQNNDSENSEIKAMENEINYKKESTEHSDKSQSGTSKNYKQSDFTNQEVQNLLDKILQLETILENLSQISDKTSVNKISPSSSIGLTDGTKNNSIYATAISDNPEFNCVCKCNKQNGEHTKPALNFACKCNKQNGEHTKRDRSCQISSKELLSIERCSKQNSDQTNLEDITPQYLLLRNSSQQSQNQSNQIRNQKNVLNDDRLRGGGNPKSCGNQSAVYYFPTTSVESGQRNYNSKHKVSRTNEEVVKIVYFLYAVCKCKNRIKCHCVDCQKKEKKYLERSKIPRLISNKTFSTKTEKNPYLITKEVGCYLSNKEIKDNYSQQGETYKNHVNEQTQ